MNVTAQLFENIQSLSDDFQKLLAAAIIDGIQELKISDYRPSPYEWKKISISENGMPSFSNYSGENAPRKYKGFFADQIIGSFKAFEGFILKNRDLSVRILSKGIIESESKNEGWISLMVSICITECIERYLHVKGDFEIDNHLLGAVVREANTFYFSPTLPIDILVPILFVKFDFDAFALNESCAIIRMNDDLQIARCKEKSYSSNIHPTVQECATHAFLLRNWEANNSESAFGFDSLSYASSYPLQEIDNLFAALRIESGVDSGYCQLISIAKGWFRDSIAHLPCAHIANIRKYPNAFDDYYWLKDDLKTVTQNECENIKNLWAQIASAEENSIQVALDRLNYCVVRDRHDDIIIDATIGMEALLNDDGRQEMTHKLALRFAALCKRFRIPDKTPAEVYSDIKSIYKYRSTLVHGSIVKPKDKFITSQNGAQTPTERCATEYLCFALKCLLQSKELRNPENIDKTILLV